MACKYDKDVNPVTKPWVSVQSDAQLKASGYCVHGGCTGYRKHPCECTASGGNYFFILVAV